MRRWWSAAGGLSRRVLSAPSVASTASHARTLPPPVISKAPSAPLPFAFSCRQHHSLRAPLAQGFFFHPPTATAFRPPVSSPLSSLIRSQGFGSIDAHFSGGVTRSRCCSSSRCGTTPRRTRIPARRSRPPSPKSRNTSSRRPRNLPALPVPPLFTSASPSKAPEVATVAFQVHEV